MSNRIEQAQQQRRNGVAGQLFADMAAGAEAMSSEDWEAGGALPDILIDLRRDRHITDEQYIAGQRLVLDMGRYHGASGGLIARYGDAVDGAEAMRLPPSRTAHLDAFARMTRVLSGLHLHERQLLAWCVLAREKARGSLADWGRQTSGYETTKTARSATVGQIRALLQSLVELYRVLPAGR